MSLYILIESFGLIYVLVLVFLAYNRAAEEVFGKSMVRGLQGHLILLIFITLATGLLSLALFTSKVKLQGEVVPLAIMPDFLKWAGFFLALIEFFSLSFYLNGSDIKNLAHRVQNLVGHTLLFSFTLLLFLLLLVEKMNWQINPWLAMLTPAALVLISLAVFKTNLERLPGIGAISVKLNNIASKFWRNTMSHAWLASLMAALFATGAVLVMLSAMVVSGRASGGSIAGGIMILFLFGFIGPFAFMAITYPLALIINTTLYWLTRLAEALVTPFSIAPAVFCKLLFHRKILCFNENCYRLSRPLRTRYHRGRRHCEHCDRLLLPRWPARLQVSFGSISPGEERYHDLNNFDFSAIRHKIDYSRVFINTDRADRKLLEKFLVFLHEYAHRPVPLLYRGNLADLHDNLENNIKTFFEERKKV